VRFVLVNSALEKDISAVPIGLWTLNMSTEKTSTLSKADLSGWPSAIPISLAPNERRESG